MNAIETRRREFYESLGSLVGRVDRLAREPRFDQEWFRGIVDGTATLQSYILANTGLGECRLDVPHAPLKPVIGADGKFMWCCEHSPSHCAR